MSSGETNVVKMKTSFSLIFFQEWSYFGLKSFSAKKRFSNHNMGWIYFLDKGIQLNKKSRRGGRVDSQCRSDRYAHRSEIFLENDKNYPKFYFKPLIILRLLAQHNKNTEFLIRLQKDMLNKNSGKKSFSWTWSQFDEQFLSSLLKNF